MYLKKSMFADVVFGERTAAVRSSVKSTEGLAMSLGMFGLCNAGFGYVWRDARRMSLFQRSPRNRRASDRSMICHELEGFLATSFKSISTMVPRLLLLVQEQLDSSQFFSLRLSQALEDLYQSNERDVSI